MCVCVRVCVSKYVCMFGCMYVYSMYTVVYYYNYCSLWGDGKMKVL